jgi:hypothetical protein
MLEVKPKRSKSPSVRAFGGDDSNLPAAPPELAGNVIDTVALTVCTHRAVCMLEGMRQKGQHGTLYAGTEHKLIESGLVSYIDENSKH